MHSVASAARVLMTIALLGASTALLHPSTPIPLAKLLSTCVDASLRGCEEIRRVQAARDAKGELDVKLKEAEDPKSALTEADLAAQAAILGGLHAAWPGIRIVGEEGEEEGTPPSEPLRHGLCSEIEGDATAALSDITIFVDPLDGTREFVEGRLYNVLSLVGFAVRGRAVGGAIGVPFPGSDAARGASVDAAAAVVYGLEGGGSSTYGERSQPQPFAGALLRPLVVTGDSSNEVLRAARDAALANGGSPVTVGGAGAKLLALAEGRADVAVMHLKTSLWDTCASEALLRSIGGKVTDLFGAPLVHSAPPAGAPESALRNQLGVVASAPSHQDVHDRVCAAMRADAASLSLLTGVETECGGHAADVARDLNGAPVTLTWIAAAVGAPLRSYHAPESGAFRGMMSEGCRLVLQPAESSTPAPPPRSVFYKRVVMGELASTRLKARTAPLKLARDVRSYDVEAAFLGSAASALLRDSAGVRVPRVYSSELRPCAASPIESRFATLAEDFAAEDGWAQQGALGEREVGASLRAFARMHAFFWSGSEFWGAGGGEAAAALEAAVWRSGCYWQPSMQPASQFGQVSDKWAEHIGTFGEQFRSAAATAGLDDADLDSLGERLQSVAKAVAADSHPFDSASGGDEDAAARYRTLLHGDAKAANLFFRTRGASSDGELEVGLIDFQWCGFGLAATEVAHHLAAALAPQVLAGDSAVSPSTEARLLDDYHAALCESLAEFGVTPSSEAAAREVFTRATLQLQYESALLDMGRLVFAYQWSRADFGTPSLNRNSYNKEIRSAVWLAARCNALLRARA